MKLGAAEIGEINALVALESPLLQGLAPELIDLRDRAVEVANRMEAPGGCSSCAKQRGALDLRIIASELMARVNNSPQLSGIFPSLMITAKQNNHV
jgi:hypothetical protein